jgi:hypothetical protein
MQKGVGLVEWTLYTLQNETYAKVNRSTHNYSCNARNSHTTPPVLVLHTPRQPSTARTQRVLHPKA